MTPKSVREFKAGDQVDQILLVTKKELRSRASGVPYGHLELRDKSGRIDAKIWDNASTFLELFGEGEFVQVRGHINSYKNRLDLIVTNIIPVPPKQIDLTNFLPHTQHDIELMLEQLKETLGEVKNVHLTKFIQSFLKDPAFMASLQKAPASLGHHQAYVGGLLEHTLNVLKLSRAVLPEYPMLNRDLLLTSAFLHDIGKAREYLVDYRFDKTIEGRLVGHIALGLEMITEKTNTIKGFPQDLALQLRHLILSHHGEMELGAPVLPMTLEAVVLHYLDNLDAKVGVRLTALEESTGKNDDWAEVWEDGGRHRIYKLNKPVAPARGPATDLPAGQAGLF